MKKNLAVMFGSRACEHDVSIVSAVQLMASVDTAKYNVIPIYISKSGAWYTGRGLQDIKTYQPFDESGGELKVVKLDFGGLGFYVDSTAGFLRKTEQIPLKVDVVIPVFHGMNGEDGTVAGVLELLNVPYASSGLLGSSVGMDKIAQKMLFKGCGFPQLNFTWVLRSEWKATRDSVLKKIEDEIGYPCFAKPANLGSSIGISKATDKASLEEALAVAFSFDRRVIIEPAVTQPLEVNCSVLGFDGDVTPSVLEAPVSWQEFLTFEDKYLSGGKSSKSGGKNGAGMASLSRRIPAPISDDMTRRVKTLSADVFRALDCKGVVRIDYMIDETTQSLYINEINTIPGSLAFYLWEAGGLPYGKLIDRLVEFAFAAHNEKNAGTFSFDSNIISHAGKGLKQM
ncbi:MAG: D-alanine--D-alanine ligase [Oscillospiraceae bacterium]|jgi:D-alanine-D-alanine ligase|nr:D-alanine--D-alanine ligase [Oscillospiraceae bacterium]